MTAKALSGVKILEWGDMVAAPYCGKLLADLGAEVVKIEDPRTGDQARRRGPFPHDVPDSEKSGLFLYLNTNKLSITLDPSLPSGRKILLDLIKGTDILIEDKPPKILRRLKLTYKVLSSVNPGLIMASITPFGAKGPYANFKGYHLTTIHAGGEGYLLPGGVVDRPPVKIGSYVGDYDAGLYAGMAVLGAHYWRVSGGTGQFLDVSKQMATMNLTRGAIGKYTKDGTVDRRAIRGSRIGTNLRCKDGYVVLQAMQEPQWQTFLDVMGRPEWAHEEILTSLETRNAHIDDVNHLIEQWTSQHTKQEVETLAQKAHIPTGAVATTEDLFKSEQLRYRGYFVEASHPKAGRLTYPSAPYKFEKTPWQLEQTAPLLGQHNELIYCRRLGYTPQKLTMLAQAGAI